MLGQINVEVLLLGLFISIIIVFSIPDNMIEVDDIYSKTVLISLIQNKYYVFEDYYCRGGDSSDIQSFLDKVIDDNYIFWADNLHLWNNQERVCAKNLVVEKISIQLTCKTIIASLGVWQNNLPETC